MQATTDSVKSDLIIKASPPTQQSPYGPNVALHLQFPLATFGFG